MLCIRQHLRSNEENNIHLKVLRERKLPKAGVESGRLAPQSGASLRSRSIAEAKSSDTTNPAKKDRPKLDSSLGALHKARSFTVAVHQADGELTPQVKLVCLELRGPANRPT